jgi:hypothetical protein
MREPESMRPVKRRVLLTGICAIMIGALAAAVAELGMTDHARPARHTQTCCIAAGSTVHHGTGATWISMGAKQPKFRWLWADLIGKTKSGAPRQISAPFLVPLGSGFVGNLTNPEGSAQGTAPHHHRNWWDDGEIMCSPFITPQRASQVIPGTRLTVGQVCPNSIRVRGHHRDRGDGVGQRPATTKARHPHSRGVPSRTKPSQRRHRATWRSVPGIIDP